MTNEEIGWMFERYESLSLGIAVDLLGIRRFESRLLGSTIGEFVAANGLMTL
jgi:hypothetical protein